MAVISKGIKLSYKQNEAQYIELTNLQEIPDLGGETEAIEITTLADGAHMYMDGLKSYGESLEFTFLYEGTQFTTLNSITGTAQWKVELPDGATCSFGGTCSTRFSGVGIGAALTYVLAIKPNTEMTWA